ncbi:tetratricopeptide repeat protein [Stigmatella sp. ncwal1]|uniref:Tetratricopeptide repeat protein n=1 Tax=Stigmatella ashevillensis TaxID=2995309 RepID=A0ABT5DC94_9BACT|nr:tetratricopeptide repeat protein [Stigmatella ashevillena]MDC0711292.1 tetratricopeptide repeat protein [Stigmatella ashevillena]
MAAGALPSEDFGPEAQACVLEADQPLSKSILWRAQRDYFEREGIAAWSAPAVPHYVTTNPSLVHAIAQTVLGYWRDCHASPSSGPLHILELGAGSGRFAYLFLRAMLELCARVPSRDVRFKYVMTDLAGSNLAFWRTHPSLRPFVDAGWLDFALFDVEKDDGLVLSESGTPLQPGSFDGPLAVIANYVFDSVPQDAFAVSEGQLHECLVTVLTDPQAPGVGTTGVFSQMRLHYSHRLAGFDHYPEPEFNQLLRGYASTLDGTTVLLPTVALRCVERLAALAKGRLLLISADRGFVHEKELAGREDPQLSVHGSFSLPVNYHAFCQWFRAKGGLALHTAHRQLSLHTCAFILGEPAAHAEETCFAYHLAFEGAGFDDFFRLRQGIESQYSMLEVEHILALLRLSRYDPRILRDCVPVLMMHAGSLSPMERQELADVVSRVWENYFHIGEARDLPFEFAGLLHTLGEPTAALALFQESLCLYGEDPRTFWNMALCAVALKRPDEAARFLARTWALAPDFNPGIALLSKDG